MRKKLTKLAPVAFENLTYDLLREYGLENLVWRTPGADGGRDLEGEFSFRDLSGSTQIQRWFIECKRYSSAIDWPTVRHKLAYAENADVDYLLFVTTSTLSPRCESEVSAWNAQRKRPQIRAWRGYQLTSLIERIPAIKLKYGLLPRATDKERGFLALAIESTKFAQAAYSASELGVSFSKPIEASAALAELLSTRMADLERYDRVQVVKFDPTGDSYDWAEIASFSTDLNADTFGLRAILAVYRAARQIDVVRLEFSKKSIDITSKNRGREIVDAAKDVFKVIAFWSEMEIRFTRNDGLRLLPR